jgi:hypothetical protein
MPKASFGKRTTLYSVSAPLHQILAAEVAREYHGRNQELPEDVDLSTDAVCAPECHHRIIVTGMS